MGMYTGLRCKVIIKPEYREEFQRIHEDNYEWENSDIDFIREYGNYSRATFIPRGALAYMPDSWEDKNGNATHGFDRKFNKNTGLWTFQCSLKDYDSTIDYFIENVLNKVVKEIIILEKFYEEDTYSTLYEFEDGKIVYSDKKGTKYEDDYYEY